MPSNITRLSAGVLIFTGWISACSAFGAQPATTRPADTAEQSTPQAALHTFWSAIDRGEADAARRACIADAVQADWVDAFASMCQGWRKMSDARKRKFNVPDQLLHTPGWNALELADQSRVELHGEEAILIPPGQKEQGVIAVRKDGKWYLDLRRSMPGDLVPTAKLFRGIAAATSQIGADIDAGKIAANADVDAALRAAMSKLNPPSTTKQSGKPAS